jgi:hypothetical protein
MKCAHPESAHPCPFAKDSVSKSDQLTRVDEHIYVPLAGMTAVRCSCGKEYDTAAQAQQHQWWQLELAKAYYVTKQPTWHNRQNHRGGDFLD